jgi:hypothetical protein
MIRIVAATILSAGLCATSALAAKPASSVFDPPLDTQKKAVPPSKDKPKATLTCSYFPHFMVKQVDEGEVGAAQLSIVAGDASHKPACQRANVATEKVIDPRDWSGYFEGVKGDYVFFNAEDGVNGGLGFAVFTTDGKKVLEDVALGDLASAKLDGATLTLGYQRNFAGDCSMPHAGDACWSKIFAATGLDPNGKPDCATGYTKAKNDLAKGRCEADKKPMAACMPAALKEIERQHWDEANSVVVYDVETVLAPGKAAAIKAAGAPADCHPSD